MRAEDIFEETIFKSYVELTIYVALPCSVCNGKNERRAEELFFVVDPKHLSVDYSIFI